MSAGPEPVPKIIYEDIHLIVLEKPAGLLSQGEKTAEPNLVDWLRAHVGRPYIGLVHRLDRNTSGLMVVAKRTKSANRLTESLQAGRLNRSYLAWLLGELRRPERWEHYLAKDERTNVSRVVKPGTAEAKVAVLRVQPKQAGAFRGSRLTLAEITLETGRSHQIRVQAAAQGHALLGDRKYGPRGAPEFPRPALHSASLRFPHPMSGEELSFNSPLPPDLANLSRSLE